MPAKINTGGYIERDKGNQDSKDQSPGVKAESGRAKLVFRSQVHDSQRRPLLSTGAPRPQKGSACATAVLGAHTSLADDDAKQAFNFNDDFDGGFLRMASTKGSIFLPNGFGMTMLADSGATEYFLDDGYPRFEGQGGRLRAAGRTEDNRGRRQPGATWDCCNWKFPRHHCRPDRQDASSVVSQLDRFRPGAPSLLFLRSNETGGRHHPRGS